MALPTLPRPERKGKSVEIPGRSGDLWMDENAYKPISFELKCRAGRDAHLPEIAAWLTGTGDLVVPQYPEHCYRARLVAAYEPEKLYPGRAPHDFSVKCDCQPFRYYATPSRILLSEAGSFGNPGTWPSAPRITVYGQGDITLTVNGVDIELISVEDSITLDSEMEDAYNSTESLNNKMTGDFPFFPLGKNIISWTGNVNRVEIQPNWRWL